MRDYPGGFSSMAVALEEFLSPPDVLVLRGEAARLREWQADLAREYRPAMLTLGVPLETAGLPELLDKRNATNSTSPAVNAWLCRGVTCLPPIGDLVHLKKALKEQA
jgi:uncharacterized protein YyaL (SSP411 family)